MSPTLLARLQATERGLMRDRNHVRRMYKRTGMTPAQARYYTARVCWHDTLTLTQRKFSGFGIGPGF